MELVINIPPIFYNETVKEYLDFFHLGKEKLKHINIYINNNESKLTDKLKENDVLTIKYDDEIDFIPEKGYLNVLYEDDNLLIVDKPLNMLVHPDSKDKIGTLANLVAYYYQKTNQNISVRYVHRIDMDTTGLVIFAKDILTNAYLANQIEENLLHREYLAIASGKFSELKGTYDYPIAEDRHIANKKRVSKTGKPAITHYEVLKVLKHNMNLVKVNLETGRTHQIRLHFSYAGHPLIGDGLYNGNTNFLNRQALHSYKVKLINPITLKEIEVISELPNDLKQIIDKNSK